MKWIKASERLPEKWHLVHARFVHTKIPLLDIKYYIQDEKKNPDLVEWLDESPLPESLNGMTIEEVYDKAFSHWQTSDLSLRDCITAAMQEYASISNKERDTRIKELEGEAIIEYAENGNLKTRIAELEKECGRLKEKSNSTDDYYKDNSISPESGSGIMKPN